MTEEDKQVQVLRKQLLRSLEESGGISDEEICEKIDHLIIRESKNQHISLRKKEELSKALFNSIRRLDILQELIDDDSITEIMVNGTEGIYIEKSGKLSKWNKRFYSKTKVEDLVQMIAGKCNRIINEMIPIADARLENGARVNLVLPPVAINGPIITIRQFPTKPINMEQLIKCEAITQEAADFLKDLVRSGYNIFISGGTGSGKTTFLNALSDYIPKDERIITIEDNAELQIQGVDNLVKLEARNSNTKGEHEISMRDLIKTSLRMRPNRIIVGEVRGSEAIDMLSAFNTGHDGSLSTGHGNGPRDMLSRLETMVLMGIELPLQAIRRQISSGIDIMIHMARMRDHTRRVAEILEVDGYQHETGEIVTHTLYEFVENIQGKDGMCGKLVRRGELQNTKKREREGIHEL